MSIIPSIRQCTKLHEIVYSRALVLEECAACRRKTSAFRSCSRTVPEPAALCVMMNGSAA